MADHLPGPVSPVATRPARFGGPRAQTARRLATPVFPFLPAVPVLAAWVLWSHFDGGYFPSTWYPSAAAAVLLVAVTAFATRRVLPASRWAQVALCLLAGFVAWNFFSLLWAESPGAGWDAANELLLALACSWTLSLLPWNAKAATIALGAWALGVTAVCAISLAGAAGAGNLSDYFIEGRYLDPIGYSNGVSALPAMAFWPALAIAYRRASPAALRVLFLAVAVFLLQFALLPQSRGAIIGLAFALPVFVALVPDRLRLIGPALVLVGATAIAIGPLYEVYDVGTELTEGAGERPLGPVVSAAAAAIALATLAATAAGAVLALLDRFVRPGERTVRAARLGVAGLLALLLVGAVGTAAVNAGTIGEEAGERWETFKSGRDTPPKPGARIAASYSDQRYDYWTVAFSTFKEKPLAGVGAGGFEDRYSAQRRYDKPSRYAHDVWLRVLAENGLLGFGLLAAFLVTALGGILWLRRRLPGAPAVVAGACLAPTLYFFVHASFDWLDQFPALLGPGLALPLVALVVLAPALGRRVLTLNLRRTGWALGALATLVAILSLALPYLSLRFVERASATWLRQPERAARDLDRAATLNPISLRPSLRAATIALRKDDLLAAQREFGESVRVEDNAYARMELAVIDASRGRFKAAEAQIRRAGELDSKDPFIADATSMIRKRSQIDPTSFNQAILDLNRERFTRPRQ